MPRKDTTTAARTSLPTAPYVRVKRFLKEGLAAGRWPTGTLMPSESELVAQFEVSRMTVTRAVRELQAEGLIDRVQGIGTFAAQLSRVSSTLTIRDLHEEILSRGHRHRAEIHLAKRERASAAVATRLGIQTGSTVFHTLMVHFENDVPLQCEDRYVNPACAPDYLSVDFTQVTPTNYLLQVAPLWEAQYSIEAGLPSEQEAQLLRLRHDEPCLVIVRSTERGGVPITIARLVHPGSRYMLSGQFKP
ncbi:histidine utilization repressor [Roseateles microcysteis]|uniref:histidine utilization repressor n=1 Tax=Roseateles microcysteis TaxID=3119057 RepID=UPI002FE61850